MFKLKYYLINIQVEILTKFNTALPLQQKRDLTCKRSEGVSITNLQK
jgi:hypothetical protein